MQWVLVKALLATVLLVTRCKLKVVWKCRSVPHCRPLWFEKEFTVCSYVSCYVFWQLTKAKSQSTVLTSYRDLVRKGQDQFSKELEQIVPDVKLGESRFTLALIFQLTWRHFTAFINNNKKLSYHRHSGCRIGEITCHYTIQGHQFWYVPVKSPYAISYQWIILMYILCCTIFQLLRIIGQIVAFDQGCLSLTHLFGLTPKLKTIKFSVYKLQMSLCLWCEIYVDILSRFGVAHLHDRLTDGWQNGF